MSGKILVTGATGNTGSGVVAMLRSAGVEVRALVRDQKKAQPLQDHVPTLAGHPARSYEQFVRDFKPAFGG